MRVHDGGGVRVMVDPVESDVEILRARIVQLETALRLVRDLMRDLPAHDNMALVAVRLRRHFDNLAGEVIADALRDV